MTQKTKIKLPQSCPYPFWKDRFFGRFGRFGPLGRFVVLPLLKPATNTDFPNIFLQFEETSLTPPRRSGGGLQIA